MQSRFFYHGLSLLILATSVSCGKSNSNKPNVAGVVRLGALDITDAKQLFVTGADTQGLLADQTSLKATTLYKVTDSGAVQEVTYQDEDGNTVTSTYYPIAIESPDSRYLVFQFGDGVSYLVRKDDGKAYILGDISRGDGIAVGSVHSIQRDRSIQEDIIGFWGLQYQELAGYSVVRAKFLDGNIEKTVVSATGDAVSKYTTDSLGNLIYSTTEWGEARLRSSAGIFSKLSDVTSFWTTKDGRILTVGDPNSNSALASDKTENKSFPQISDVPKVFFLDESTKVGYIYNQVSNSSSPEYCGRAPGLTQFCTTATHVIELTTDKPHLAIEEMTAAGLTGLSYESTGFIKSTRNDIKAHAKDTLGTSAVTPKYISPNPSEDVFIPTPGDCRLGKYIAQLTVDGSYGNGKVVMLTNEDDFSQDVYAFPGASQAVCTDTALYAIGMDEQIYKFDLPTKTYSQFEVANVLDISSIRVGGGEILTIQGRLNDGSQFIGNINSSGELTILSRIATGQITIITPLN